ncbi:MAG: hypothetical protein WA154_06830 [Moraxellaceae bacterium]
MPKLLQRFNEVHDSLGAATPVDLTDWARVAAMTDEEIAFDRDNPATTEVDWAGADQVLRYCVNTHTRWLFTITFVLIAGLLC